MNTISNLQFQFESFGIPKLDVLFFVCFLSQVFFLAGFFCLDLSAARVLENAL